MSSVIDEEVKSEKEKDPDSPKIVDADGLPLLERAHHEEAVRKRPLFRRPAFLIVAAIILVVAAIVGIRYWLYARSHESTDDAFIEAHVIQISPKVSGHVVKLYVDSNQQVNKGDLLAEIDPRDYQAKVDQAKAALTAGQARLKEARSGVDLARA
ncbi:MAG TPA: biotin/lipoyl-binding protein, partial [Pyrinomonadaceae bacterium]